MIVTKISFSQKQSNNSLKIKDTIHQLDAKTAGLKERLKKELAAFGDIDYDSFLWAPSKSLYIIKLKQTSSLCSKGIPPPNPPFKPTNFFLQGLLFFVYLYARLLFQSPDHFFNIRIFPVRQPPKQNARMHALGSG